MNDIQAVKNAWTSDEYFRAGADLAQLMNVAVGPIEANGLEGFELPPLDKVIPDFTAGLLQGFTGNDHRAELEGCMTDLEPLAMDAMTAFDDIKSFHMMKFAGDLGNFIWLLPDAISSCEQLAELEADLKVVEDWTAVLKNPLKVSKIASKNWLFHGTQIKADIEKEESNWTAGDYYGAGQETAAVLLGLVPEDSEVEKLMLEFVLN